jgi:hypothetical protein
MNSLLFTAHQVDDIPRADITQRFGRRKARTRACSAIAKRTRNGR